MQSHTSGTGVGTGEALSGSGTGFEAVFPNPENNTAPDLGEPHTSSVLKDIFFLIILILFVLLYKERSRIDPSHDTCISQKF